MTLAISLGEVDCASISGIFKMSNISDRGVAIPLRDLT